MLRVVLALDIDFVICNVYSFTTCILFFTIMAKESIFKAAKRLNGKQPCLGCPFFNGKICTGSDKVMKTCRFWFIKGFMRGAKYYRDNFVKRENKK